MDSILDSKDKYRIIFDKINDMITLCDPEYTIIESNHSANILLGNGESIVGKKCYRVFRGNSSPCVNCPLSETLASGIVQPISVYDERFGEYFEERTYPVLNNAAELNGFILISKNVTKAREIEEKSALMKKLTALGQISSGVAHDFNNVLTVVLGRVQLMKKQVIDPLILNSLEMIEKSALDGAAKVRKIQEFARPKKDKLTDAVDLKKLLEEVFDITRPKWEEASKVKGIIIEPVLLLDDRLYILGDSSDLRNAFTNIIFNAVDAMPDGGVLTVKSSKEGQYALIEFKDTGTGMTEETIEKIFDPFFTTKGVMGTGLGMSEVYGIIQRHNGRIEVKSTIGKGTGILLRFMAARKAEIQTTVEEVNSSRPCRILVVDDEAYILEVLDELLSSMGHEVKTNSSAMAAIQDFKKYPYDIVITDLGMPEMSGHEVAAKVKALHPRTQVIVVSGWALNMEIEDKARQTIDFVISKPFAIETITKVIFEAVSKYYSLKD